MNDKILKNTLAVLGLVFSAICFLNGNAFGQAETNKSVSTNQTQITADENFELNIKQERITETDFTRSTNVELSDSRGGGLKLEVGVGVRASSIDLILRGIYGRVSFRASLESIRQKIEKLKLQNSNGQVPNLPQP